MLLDMKADADKPFLYGYTPLALAAEVSASWCIVLFGSDGSSTTLLTGIMQSGHAEVVEMLFEAGARAGKPMPDGYTPLAAAAKVRHQETSSGRDAHSQCFCLVSCREGMPRWSKCCLKQVQVLASPCLMATHPWLRLQR